MCVSRPQYLHSLGALDVAGKAVLCLLTVEGQRRQFFHAAFVDLGNDEMMSRIGETLARRAIELFHGAYDVRVLDTRAARNGGQIGPAGGSGPQSPTSLVRLVIEDDMHQVLEILVRQVRQTREIEQ